MCVCVCVVHDLLDYEQESTGISSKRIILGDSVTFLVVFSLHVCYSAFVFQSLPGGLSQGGSLAMLAALTYSKPLAGIIALSTWMSLHEKIPEVSQPGRSGDSEVVCLYSLLLNYHLVRVFTILS